MPTDYGGHFVGICFLHVRCDLEEYHPSDLVGEPSLLFLMICVSDSFFGSFGLTRNAKKSLLSSSTKRDFSTVSPMGLGTVTDFLHNGQFFLRPPSGAGALMRVPQWVQAKRMGWVFML